MTVVTSATQPPSFMGVNYWERSLDPWHADAFPANLKHAASIQSGPRRCGWMAIDGSENAIGFVPDGTEHLGLDKFEIRLGPCGRMCAYRAAALAQPGDAQGGGG